MAKGKATKAAPKKAVAKKTAVKKVAAKAAPKAAKKAVVAAEKKPAGNVGVALKKGTDPQYKREYNQLRYNLLQKKITGDVFRTQWAALKKKFGIGGK